MSEKSMGNAHNEAAEAKKAPNRSAFQPQEGVWSRKTSYQRYNSGESEMENKIPVQRL